MGSLPNEFVDKLTEKNKTKQNTLLWILEFQARDLGPRIFLMQNCLLIFVHSFIFFSTLLLDYSSMYHIFKKNLFSSFTFSSISFPLYSMSMATNGDLNTFLFHLSMQVVLMRRETHHFSETLKISAFTWKLRTIYWEIRMFFWH